MIKIKNVCLINFLKLTYILLFLQVFFIQIIYWARYGFKVG